MEYNNYITYSTCYGSVRVELSEDGKPWFFATDVAKMLEGKADHVSYKMKKVAEDEKKLVKRLVKSGVRNVYLVNLEGFTTLSAETKCHRERAEAISDLLISAWNQALSDECNKIYGTNPEPTEEIKAEEPEAVEKLLEDYEDQIKTAIDLFQGDKGKSPEEVATEENKAEEPVVESRVEEEKATVEEKQVNNNLTVFENS